MNIYVSNLSFGVDSEDLLSHFSQYGKVNSVNIVTDKLANQSKSSAMVEMPEQEQAEKAIAALNGLSLSGRPMILNRNKPAEEPARRHRRVY